MFCLGSELVLGVEVVWNVKGGRSREGHLVWWNGQTVRLCLGREATSFSMVHRLWGRHPCSHRGVHVVGQQQSDNRRDHGCSVGGSRNGWGAVRGL